MNVTLKRWLKAGEVIDRRARGHAERYGVTYGDAVREVLKKDKRLRGLYHRSAPRDRTVDQLNDLAEFLNDNPKHPLYEAVWALKDPITSIKNVEKAWSFLEPRLRSKAKFGYMRRIPTGKPDEPFVFGITYATDDADPYSMVFQAIYEKKFSLLRYCRWKECGKFFVSSDRRQGYCSKLCSKAYESFRVKRWRDRKRGWK